MDLFKSGSKKVSICDTTNERGAAIALGGKFLREDCGVFEKCSHQVEDYDFTNSNGVNVVEIWYCQIDWTKAGPLVLGILLVCFFIYRKYKQMQSTGRFAGIGRNRHSMRSKHSSFRG